MTCQVDDSMRIFDRPRPTVFPHRASSLVRLDEDRVEIGLFVPAVGS